MKNNSNNLNLVALAAGRFLEWIIKNIIQFREASNYETREKKTMH